MTKRDLVVGNRYYIYLLDQDEWWIECTLLRIKNNGVQVQQINNIKSRFIRYKKIDKIASVV